MTNWLARCIINWISRFVWQNTMCIVIDELLKENFLHSFHLFGLWFGGNPITWLVVWNIFNFPNSWDDDPIWLSYSSGGVKPLTRITLLFVVKSCGKIIEFCKFPWRLWSRCILFYFSGGAFILIPWDISEISWNISQ